MFLPLALWAFLEIDSRFSTVLPSISHYYYSRACSVFIISVSSLAFFLLIYKGENKVDFYVSLVAGLAAIILLLLPTTNLIGTRFGSVCTTTLRESPVRETIHYLSAGVFLLALAYMSFFLFTLSNCTVEERPREKTIHNRIFRTSAVIIVLSVLVILLRFMEILSLRFLQYYDLHCLTFWLETAAVEAFGFAWLIKGETFFQDKDPDKCRKSRTSPAAEARAV